MMFISVEDNRYCPRHARYLNQAIGACAGGNAVNIVCSEENDDLLLSDSSGCKKAATVLNKAVGLFRGEAVRNNTLVSTGTGKFLGKFNSTQNDCISRCDKMDACRAANSLPNGVCNLYGADYFLGAGSGATAWIKTASKKESMSCAFGSIYDAGKSLADCNLYMESLNDMVVANYYRNWTTCGVTTTTTTTTTATKKTGESVGEAKSMAERPSFVAGSVVVAVVLLLVVVVVAYVQFRPAKVGHDDGGVYSESMPVPQVCLNTIDPTLETVRGSVRAYECGADTEDPYSTIEDHGGTAARNIAAGALGATGANCTDAETQHLYCTAEGISSSSPGTPPAAYDDMALNQEGLPAQAHDYRDGTLVVHPEGHDYRTNGGATCQTLYSVINDFNSQADDEIMLVSTDIESAGQLTDTATTTATAATTSIATAPLDDLYDNGELDEGYLQVDVDSNASSTDTDDDSGDDPNSDTEEHGDEGKNTRAGAPARDARWAYSNGAFTATHTDLAGTQSPAANTPRRQTVWHHDDVSSNLELETGTDAQPHTTGSSAGSSPEPLYDDCEDDSALEAPPPLDFVETDSFAQRNRPTQQSWRRMFRAGGRARSFGGSNL